MVDYSDVYDSYWLQPGRIGKPPFEDISSLVRQILAICGTGRILDIGCGMGSLVQELLKQGVDAYGVDVSSVAAAHCNQFAPGRFYTGSVLALPFPDETFDTLISTNCLEHLAPDDVKQALREMHRVCRRQLFFRVATGQDLDGPWNLTVESRSWWENAAFGVGFRKHPAYYTANPFESLERDEFNISIPLWKIPVPVLTRYPLAALHAERDLHMDMLRESGRRSDAHVHRYAVAASLVRPGDHVLDAACGLGYGTHLLACLTEAGRLVGMDLSNSVIDYATTCFGSGDKHIVFRAGDVQDLSEFDDNSIDLVVSFETLEHIPQPEQFLKEAARVMRPGGRIIVSVPHLWVDASGRDPNPWHLHVYDWQKLRDQLGEHFLIETAWGETAGGGMRLPQHPRDFFTFDPQIGPLRDCEWLLAVGMRDPREGRGLAYEERMYALEEHPEHLIEFARDYLNPYLPHAMVSIPWRLADVRLLDALARDVSASYPADSSDHAAAVCVLAYRYLADPQANAQAGFDLLGQFAAIDQNRPLNPHVLRWRISGAYVSGLINLRLGNHVAALDSFRRCATFDCRDFSPTLGTKTIAAAWQAGRLLAQHGDPMGARYELERGLEIFFGLFRDGRAGLLGKAKRPFDFPYFELTEVVAAVTNCVNLLRQIDQVPGTTHQAMPVENLQTVITSLRAEVSGLKEAHQVCLAALTEADRHWSIRVLRKTYRFMKKLIRRP